MKTIAYILTFILAALLNVALGRVFDTLKFDNLSFSQYTNIQIVYALIVCIVWAAWLNIAKLIKSLD